MLFVDSHIHISEVGESYLAGGQAALLLWDATLQCVWCEGGFLCRTLTIQQRGHPHATDIEGSASRLDALQPSPTRTDRHPPPHISGDPEA